MPEINQVITFLYTHNLAATAEFYEEKLGLRLVRNQGHCRIYHVCGAAYLGFCDRIDRPDSPVGVVFTLVTAEVDEWCARLKAQGVEFVKEPAENPTYRIYNAFVRDPNGYLIEIQRFWEKLE